MTDAEQNIGWCHAQGYPSRANQTNFYRPDKLNCQCEPNFGHLTVDSIQNISWKCHNCPFEQVFVCFTMPGSSWCGSLLNAYSASACGVLLDVCSVSVFGVVHNANVFFVMSRFSVWHSMDVCLFLSRFMVWYSMLLLSRLGYSSLQCLVGTPPRLITARPWVLEFGSLHGVPYYRPSWMK